MFSNGLIEDILERARLGVPIDPLCKSFGISEKVIYKWKLRFEEKMVPTLGSLKTEIIQMKSDIQELQALAKK